MRALLIAGSTRRDSTNNAVLRTAAELLPPGVEAVLHEELDALPHFNPDHDQDPLPPQVTALREAIAEADLVIMCTPEYAGTLPGSFKNLLDWTVGGSEIHGKPTTWINIAAPGRGGGADATLRTVLGYVGAALLPSSGRRTPVGRDIIGPPGIITDDAVRQDLAELLAALTDEAKSLRT
ncbi:MAG TPA: NADPH-dependent FMN reductase [Solirubrobacteraceae bacterium]|nr:NADPH-dependent FMN reductase [Solirubrobacteraceae bacterium]